jgi:translation initiation factor 1
MTGKPNDNHRIVYSTEHGRMCPECCRPAGECACGRKKGFPRGDGVVRVGRETKGRKGKGVTVVTGLPLDGGALEKLARELKQRCGAGGTVKDGRIEIQGDHRDVLLEALRAQGYTVKLSGG